MTKDRATEIREAIDAADAALKHLGNAADMLDDAGRWGIVDMLGGGLITTLLKHRKISDAQDEIDEAKRALRIFVKELDDVDEATGLNVELGSGLQFADIFFDAVIVIIIVIDVLTDIAVKVVAKVFQFTPLSDIVNKFIPCHVLILHFHYFS